MGRWVAFVMAACAAGCGLGVAGLGGDQSTPTADAAGGDAPSLGPEGGDAAAGSRDADGATPDAAPDATDATDAPSDVTGPCLDALGPSWTVLEVGMANATCPDGSMPAAAISAPKAQAGACTCQCGVTAPSCTVGTVTVTHAPMCDQGNDVLQADGTCVDFMGDNYVIDGHHALTPPAPSGGSCTWNETANPALVGGTPHGLCSVAASSLEAVCEGMVPGGWGSCVMAANDVPCPAMFGKKTLVFDPNPGLSCSPCAPCTLDARCTGTLDLYADGACSQNMLLAQSPADGKCDPTPMGGTPFNSWNYVAGTSATCDGMPPMSMPTVTPANPRTVCCR